jgi:hypothetical protein
MNYSPKNSKLGLNQKLKFSFHGKINLKQGQIPYKEIKIILIFGPVNM